MCELIQRHDPLINLTLAARLNDVQITQSLESESKEAYPS
jgi:hypothetical protein